MIHWGWLIPAFMAGGLGGVAVMCLMFAARDGDNAMEVMRDDSAERNP